MSPADVASLTAAAGEAAAAIGPDVDTVKGNFWGAVQEYFNGSSITFDGEWWRACRNTGKPRRRRSPKAARGSPTS